MRGCYGLRSNWTLSARDFAGTTLPRGKRGELPFTTAGAAEDQRRRPGRSFPRPLQQQRPAEASGLTRGVKRLPAPIPLRHSGTAPNRTFRASAGPPLLQRSSDGGGPEEGAAVGNTAKPIAVGRQKRPPAVGHPTIAVGHPTIVADARQAFGKHVQQEAAGGPVVQRCASAREAAVHDLALLHFAKLATVTSVAKLASRILPQSGDNTG